MKKNPGRTCWRVLASLTVLAVVGSACTPPPAEIPPATPVAERSRILSADGAVLETLFVENREPVPLDKVPEPVIDAVIAAEDQRFWSHPGYDARAIVRAGLSNAAAKKTVQGGSTITQQLVKNIYFPQGRAKTLEQKIKEARLAAQVESKKTKKQILEQYLNTVYFGQGAYGIQAASEQFFNKDVSTLTLPEAALLAAVIRAPDRYDPRFAADRALGRRNYVLERMQILGMITHAEKEEAAVSGLSLNPPPREPSSEPYFVDYVRRYVLQNEAFGADEQSRAAFLYRSGVEIRTTLDSRMQAAAKEAASILGRAGDPEVAIAAIDPKTGKVLALVGGRDWSASQVNLALGAGGGGTGRQPGSSFKPFVLAAALEGGMTPETLYSADPPRIRVGRNQYWTPKNSEGGGRGQMTLRDATVSSVNTVFARLGADLGPSRVVATAKRIGVRSPMENVYTVSLGTEEVSPLDMASAFGTFANYGVHLEPSPILEVKGKSTAQPKQKLTRAMEPGTAWLITDVLRGVIDRGTGRRADIGRPAAGKTGTSQNYADAWFVGYTPDLVTAVWVGYPEGQVPMNNVRGSRVFGGTFPAAIWAAFMRKALEGRPSLEFELPLSDLVTIDIDPETGLLAGPLCRGRQTVQMLRQLAPRTTCGGGVPVAGNHQTVTGTAGDERRDGVQMPSPSPSPSSAEPPPGESPPPQQSPPASPSPNP